MAETYCQSERFREIQPLNNVQWGKKVLYLKNILSLFVFEININFPSEG